MLRSCLGKIVNLLRTSSGEVTNGSNTGIFGALGSVRHSRHEREWSYRSLPKLDEGTAGELTQDIDAKINRQTLFPDENSYSRLFEGVPFNQLPVVEIKVTKNNTIMTLCNAMGVPQIIRSCGIEGFKNARKGTNIAAQATSISFSNVCNLYFRTYVDKKLDIEKKDLESTRLLK